MPSHIPSFPPHPQPTHLFPLPLISPAINNQPRFPRTPCQSSSKSPSAHEFPVCPISTCSGFATGRDDAVIGGAATALMHAVAEGRECDKTSQSTANQQQPNSRTHNVPPVSQTQHIMNKTPLCERVDTRTILLLCLCVEFFSPSSPLPMSCCYCSCQCNVLFQTKASYRVASQYFFHILLVKTAVHGSCIFCRHLCLPQPMSKLISSCGGHLASLVL